MNFNEIVNKFIENNKINEKTSNEIFTQFKNISTDGDKYKWCCILSKESSKSKNKDYYKNILKICEEYKDELLKSSLSPNNLEINSKVSRREISIMANCGNESWGILTDNKNKKIFIAINENEPYKYPKKDGEYIKKYNRVEHDKNLISIKCYIQAIKGEENPLENIKNRRVWQCTGDNDYKLYVFVRQDKEKKFLNYLGEFITCDVGSEKIDNLNIAYYFIFKNIVSNDEKEKISYNLFTKFNKLADNELDKLVKNDFISEEEKYASIKIRINQSIYRSKLLKIYNKCPITEISDHKLLIASHIKPYSKSSSKEKYDTNNGIILSPLIDKLFDKFLITFDAWTGKIKYSKNINNDDIKKIKSHIVNDYIDISNRKITHFLKYHNIEFEKKSYLSE